MFSIFARVFLAGSGFLVFIVSARLFGAEGRGVISYGVSLFAFSSIIFSFSLGKTFIAATSQKNDLKSAYIFSFLALNFLASVCASLFGVLFWCLSESAQSILTFHELLAFSIMPFFFVWSFNGTSFFAAFLKTTRQEIIIFFSRLLLVIMLGIYLYFKLVDVRSFIFAYSLILVFGVMCEQIYLFFNIKGHDRFISREFLAESFRKTFWPHLDFLSFNAFPLILIVMSGVFLSKAALGRANFSIQLINFVFLLSTTANIRLSAYISDVGIRQRSQQFIKLLKITFAASLALVLMIYIALPMMTRLSFFSSFDGIEKLFLWISISVPGYMLYQFLNPIWLEASNMQWTAKSSFVNLVINMLLLPFLVTYYGELGIVLSFSLFHVVLLVVQWLMFRRLVHVNDGAIKFKIQ
ncbi:hypothetical protein CIK05_07150 [Bdellovibrio sp. qaytius]|nr:hypothetical protein CIK05_07150 [Bdellovibrio sp. qaytius]